MAWLKCVSADSWRACDNVRLVGGAAVYRVGELVAWLLFAPADWSKGRNVSVLGAPSQTSTLEEFAATLEAGQLRAVAVDSSEISIEGRFWLCEVLGQAFKATEAQAHATDLFEEGWWVVEIKWYERVGSASSRKYKLVHGSKRFLAVNAIIRVDGLEFDGGNRVPRSGERMLNERSRELIEACNS